MAIYGRLICQYPDSPVSTSQYLTFKKKDDVEKVLGKACSIAIGGADYIDCTLIIWNDSTLKDQTRFRFTQKDKL